MHSQVTASPRSTGNGGFKRDFAAGYQRVPDGDVQPAAADVITPYARRSASCIESEPADVPHTAPFFTVDEPPSRTPVVLLPWRMALLLFVSTLAQCFSYHISDYITGNSGYRAWTPEKKEQLTQLMYVSVYIGPVCGLIIDIVRVAGERYRFVMLLAALGNASLCFLCFGKPTLFCHYDRTLVTASIMQVLVMFMYIPATSMVIAHGNSYLETRAESSARIGGLMAQTMAARSFAAFISTFTATFLVSGVDHANRPRAMVLLGGICSCLVVLLLVNPFTIKRSYFLECGERHFVYTAPKRFLLSAMRAHRDAFRPNAKVGNTAFVSVVTFTFLYFMLPDVLYRDSWQITAQYGAEYSSGWNGMIPCFGQLGATLGALLYALWMFSYQRFDRLDMRSMSTTPFMVVLVGCCAWVSGTFFYLFGVLGHRYGMFSWDVYLPIQAIVVESCLRFAFMPALSLVSMHAPSGYPSAAFQLFSLASVGGGQVSALITTSLGCWTGSRKIDGSLDMGTYWRIVLLCIFLRFLILLPALTLPKCRDDDESKLISFADEDETTLEVSPDEL